VVKQMKALLLRETAPIETAPLEPVEIPVPEPGDREILIQVRACGLCHTDLHTVEGELALPKMPVVPGHQIVGVVQRVGEGVGQPRPGDRVGVGWLNSTCGECAFCESGRENLCPGGRFTGCHVDGGYAEYVVAPAAFTYPLPQGFSDEQAAPLLCGGVIGYRALRLSGIQPGGVLGLYGFGASAHIVIQVARHWGCRVLVFTRSAAHQELAVLLGAAWAGQAAQMPPEDPDSSIIFAPAGSLVPLALGRLKRGGTLALAGITMSPIPEMPYELLYGERTVRSVANATRRDARELLALAEEVPVETRVQVFGLPDVNRALHLLKLGRINGAGVVKVATD
tara:strand:+ start:1281 stop:2297 length:1017 start_codon:yes stop_codon:yes gene_type:complete